MLCTSNEFIYLWQVCCESTYHAVLFRRVSINCWKVSEYLGNDCVAVMISRVNKGYQILCATVMLTAILIAKKFNDVSSCGAFVFVAPLFPQIRNSSTLLFSALVARIFGAQRVADQHSMENKMTAKDFFTRCPSLHGFLLEQLNNTGEMLERQDGKWALSSCIHFFLTESFISAKSILHLIFFSSGNYTSGSKF